MKLSKKQHSIITRQLSIWQEKELLSKEKSEQLKSTLEKKEINWKKVAQNMLGLAVFFMVVAFLHLVADEWILNLLSKFFSMSDTFFMLFLLVLMVGFAVGASRIEKLPAPINGKVFQESLLLMSILSATGMFYYASSVFELKGGTQILLVLITSIGTLRLGQHFKAVVIWLLGCVGATIWFGLATTHYSDWEPTFLGLNLPTRYLIFSWITILAIKHLQKLKVIKWLFIITQQYLYLLMWFSLWLVALFGNFSSWTRWEEASALTLLPGGILMAIIAALFWWQGRKNNNLNLVWMGSIALLADAYTQYFLFLWEPLPAALFFFIIAVSLFFLGRKAEVIWGK